MESSFQRHTTTAEEEQLGFRTTMIGDKINEKNKNKLTAKTQITAL